MTLDGDVNETQEVFDEPDAWGTCSRAAVPFRHVLNRISLLQRLLLMLPSQDAAEYVRARPASVPRRLD